MQNDENIEITTHFFTHILSSNIQTMHHNHSIPLRINFADTYAMIKKRFWYVSIPKPGLKATKSCRKK